MTQDPSLFTAIEWVLLSMAGLISLLIYAVSHKNEPGSPFADQGENLRHERREADGRSARNTVPDGK